MKARRNKYEKFTDELFARLIEIDGLKKITIGIFCRNFINDPNLAPLSNVELNDIWSLEVEDVVTIRSINIKRLS
ncbi:hypothetical protein ACVW0P_000087 [Mucilaginibacter sp. UYNi724]